MLSFSLSLLYLSLNFLGGHSLHPYLPLMISSLAAWASQFHENKSLASGRWRRRKPREYVTGHTQNFSGVSRLKSSIKSVRFEKWLFKSIHGSYALLLEPRTTQKLHTQQEASTPPIEWQTNIKEWALDATLVFLHASILFRYILAMKLILPFFLLNIEYSLAKYINCCSIIVISWRKLKILVSWYSLVYAGF